MTRKARLWIGATFLAIIILNYVMFGYPMAKRQLALKRRADAILIRQVKGGQFFRESDEEYVLELFRKEKRELDRKVRLLNGIALTCIVIITSWTVFGLIFVKKR